MTALVKPRTYTCARCGDPVPHYLAMRSAWTRKFYCRRIDECARRAKEAK